MCLKLLIPSEHGTWGELSFPLLAALAIGRPPAEAWLLAAAAALAYLSSESVQVLAGWRGARAGRERRRDAQVSLALFATAAAVLFALAWRSSTFEVRAAVAGAAVLGAFTWGLAFAGGLRTAAGELLAATALAAWAVPVAIAGGVAAVEALGLALLWAAAFGAATLAVRSLIDRNTRRDARPARLASLGILGTTLAMLGWLASSRAIGALVVIGFLPFASFVIAVACAPIPARRLRSVGWSLVAASAILFAALVA